MPSLKDIKTTVELNKDEMWAIVHSLGASITQGAVKYWKHQFDPNCGLTFADYVCKKNESAYEVYGFFVGLLGRLDVLASLNLSLNEMFPNHTKEVNKYEDTST